MAEGWSRHLKNDVIEPYSAGTEIHGINPYAVKVMKEAGVDISGQKSKDLHNLMDIPFDYVITLCDHASESCPLFPGNVKRVHVGFNDPPGLTSKLENEDQKLDIYRRVRDEIKAFIKTLPENLEQI